MKKNILFLLSLVTLMFNSGCSDKSSSGTDPFGGGVGTTGGTGTVTFTIGHTQGNQGIVFTAKPSVDATVSEFTINLPAQNFTETYQGDGTTVFKAGSVYSIQEYTGVASGQQWTFNFKGKLGSSTGQDYNVNSNYTVP